MAWRSETHSKNKFFLFQISRFVSLVDTFFDEIQKSEEFTILMKVFPFFKLNFPTTKLSRAVDYLRFVNTCNPKKNDAKNFSRKSIIFRRRTIFGRIDLV